ncbi:MULTISPECIES: SseB family protein [Nocardia]|uniref:SseB family protein n=1 Tax=Nocardia iowensis TaxID=204891 RepID=A0ABX8RGX3_NOCIO|nr:SseB family protein [Nocardia iowensis]QXN88854.1 SseB family protein [Nocardia iowensis]
MGDGDGRAALRSEIAAFYAGFGQPDALLAAFREAALLVPVTDDERVYVSQFGGIDWLCAFTSIEEYARYMMARGYLADGGIDADREYRYHSLSGWRLLAYAETRDQPTGVTVDVVGSAPMAFPPDVTE